MLYTNKNDFFTFQMWHMQRTAYAHILAAFRGAGWRYVLCTTPDSGHRLVQRARCYAEGSRACDTHPSIRLDPSAIYHRVRNQNSPRKARGKKELCNLHLDHSLEEQLLFYSQLRFTVKKIKSQFSLEDFEGAPSANECRLKASLKCG